MYISNAELGVPEELLIRLTDDEGTGMVNAARADEAIKAASGYVDAALSARFDTPVDDPGEQIKGITRDIAVYIMHLRTGAVPDDVRAARDNAAALLDKAAAGLIHLGLLPHTASPAFSSNGREYTRGYMEGF